MPLKSGSSRSVVKGNIHEMVHSDTFAKGKPKSKRAQMAVAAALGKAKYKGAKKRRAQSGGDIRHLAALRIAQGGR